MHKMMMRKLLLSAYNLPRRETHRRMFTSQERNRSSPQQLLEQESLEPECILKQSHIDEAIKFSPSLASTSPELWEKSHQTFINHGLKTTNFLQIVIKNPSLLTRQTDKIIDSFEVWRSCQFGEKMLFLLLTKYPTLLNITDGISLLRHITFLKGYVSTNKNVWKLLMNSPDLMEQSEDCITEKFIYITDKMRIFAPEIVKSCALSKSLDEIKCRHIFLVRLGIFKARSLKSNPDEPTKNHRLYQITDTSEKTFATKICHVSLAEFEAFQELLQREKSKTLEELDDSDDEDGS